MAKKAPCPSCGKPFGRRIKGKCPHCEEPLKLVRKKEGTLNIIQWELVNEKRPEPIKVEPIIDTNIIVDQSDIKIVQTGKKQWHILYKALPQRGICPNCHKVIFKHARFLKGSIEIKCDRCGDIITTEFDVFARQRMSPSP